MWQRNSYGRRVLISGSPHSFAHAKAQYAALVAEQEALIAKYEAVVAELTGLQCEVAELREEVERLSEALGRRLKFLVGKPGLDGHSNGAEQIAVRARDAGMDVVYEGFRLTPTQIANSAAQEGVPTVYEAGGTEYIVFPVGGNGEFSNNLGLPKPEPGSNEYIAFALPK